MGDVHRFAGQLGITTLYHYQDFSPGVHQHALLTCSLTSAVFALTRLHSTILGTANPSSILIFLPIPRPSQQWPKHSFPLPVPAASLETTNDYAMIRAS